MRSIKAEQLIKVNTRKYKKDSQLFETPSAVVRMMLSLARVEPDDKVFEPEVGRGAILRELLKITPYVEVNEIDLVNNAIISEGFPTIKNFESDTLNLNLSGRYDKIIMNPPFSSNQDIDHVLHVFPMLKKRGTLVSLLGPSVFFRDTKKTRKFRDFLNRTKSFVFKLDKKMFLESGTLIDPWVLTIKK